MNREVVFKCAAVFAFITLVAAWAALIGAKRLVLSFPGAHLMVFGTRCDGNASQGAFVFATPESIGIFGKFRGLVEGF